MLSFSPECKTSQSPYSLFFVGWLKRIMSEFFYFYSENFGAGVECSIFLEGPYEVNTSRCSIINKHF